jgi:hypothetical protein
VCVIANIYYADSESSDYDYIDAAANVSDSDDPEYLGEKNFQPKVKTESPNENLREEYPYCFDEDKPLLREVADDLETLGFEICRSLCSGDVNQALLSGMAALKDIFTGNKST